MDGMKEIAEQAGVVEPVAGFPCWFWDFDNDGHLDLFVSAYSATLADLTDSYLERAPTVELARRRLGPFVPDGAPEEAAAPPDEQAALARLERARAWNVFGRRFYVLILLMVGIVLVIILATLMPLLEITNSMS